MNEQIPVSLSEGEIDTLTGFCDIAVRTQGLNVAQVALALATKLQQAKEDAAKAKQ